MKVNDFISKLKHIESLPTTYYSVAGGSWAMWNGYSWNFDCVILIKAILWGWNGNKNHPHGGAIYGSNGVYDDNCEGIIARCKNVSTDFTNIEPGELLYMPGHVGIYIGNGNVIECTAAWGRKVLYSKVSSNGMRSKNGSVVGYWKKHGKLPYIDYSKEVVLHDPIKDANDCEVTYIVKKGDVLWKIAQKYNTSVSELARINKLDNPDLIHIGQKLIIRKESSTSIFYIVKSGDTLWKIANKYGISTQKLYNDNKNVIGSNPNLIQVGMKLTINK